MSNVWISGDLLIIYQSKVTKNAYHILLNIIKKSTLNLNLASTSIGRVTRKNVTTCQQRRTSFAMLGVSFCVTRNAFSFTEKNTRTQGQSSSSIIFPYDVLFLLMELLVIFVSHTNFPQCDGSIFIFDGCWLNIIFTKISSCIKVFNFKKYGAPIIHV